MNENIPLVSIIIPVYNGGNFMREAIDSALSQTYRNIEVIVVNDGSTDNTEEIALSYGNKIRYFKKDNGGVSSALNLGIKEMHGEYFSWLSHDDVYHPDKISSQVNALLEASSVGKNTIVWCKSEYIDKDSALIKKRHKKTSEESVWSWEHALHYLLLHGPYNGCALLIPKEAFVHCGLFDETLRFNQDGMMWTKIFLQGYSLLRLNSIGVKSRIHENQVTLKKQDWFHKDCEAMSQYLIPELIQITTKKDRFLYDYAKYNGKYNNRTILQQIKKKATYQQLTFLERIIVSGYSLYGKMRPCIRQVYLKLSNL